MPRRSSTLVFSKSPAVQLFAERFLQAATERVHRVHGASLQAACEKAGL